MVSSAYLRLLIFLLAVLIPACTSSSLTFRLMYFAYKDALRWLSGKESTCNAEDPRDVGLIPGSGRSSGAGNGSLLQYSCLENPMGRGAWRAAVRGLQRARHAWATGTHVIVCAWSCVIAFHQRVRHFFLRRKYCRRYHRAKHQKGKNQRHNFLES